MSPVSADNAQLTSEVDSFMSAYATFQTLIRGAIVEAVGKLNNGGATFGEVTQILNKIERDFIDATRMRSLRMLGDASVSALETAETKTQIKTAQKLMDTAEELHSSFASDIEWAIRKAVSADIKAAQEFLSVQMMSGHYVVSSDDIARDLVFNTKDKAGRQLATKDFLFREVNYGTRGLYNSTLAVSLMQVGIDKGKVDGGSKDGTELDLDELSGPATMKFFHHNSKSLLQPLD